MKEIVYSPTMSSIIALHGLGNADRAASSAWRAMGDDGFGVREVRGSNPGSVSNESHRVYLELGRRLSLGRMIMNKLIAVMKNHDVKHSEETPQYFS